MEMKEKVKNIFMSDFASLSGIAFHGMVTMYLIFISIKLYETMNIVLLTSAAFIICMDHFTIAHKLYLRVVNGKNREVKK